MKTSIQSTHHKKNAQLECALTLAYRDCVSECALPLSLMSALFAFCAILSHTSFGCTTTTTTRKSFFLLVRRQCVAFLSLFDKWFSSRDDFYTRMLLCCLIAPCRPALACDTFAGLRRACVGEQSRSRENLLLSCN